MSQKEPEKLYLELRKHIYAMNQEQEVIHDKLTRYADGKKLKGNEFVGWLGEIYGKLFLDGILVSDKFEHDFITKDKKRIAVKARRGTRSGWKRTSAIPKIIGSGCPTHLMFVHLNDDYAIDRMWLYKWQYLRNSGRFKEHIVRGSRRSFYFEVNPESDSEYLIYNRTKGDK